MGEPSVNSYKNQRQYENIQIDKILPYYIQHLSIIPDRTQACEVFDFTFYHKSNIFKVEEKFRKVDYGDFLIEIMQDIATCNHGWFYKTEADYIFYIVDMKYLYSVKWNLFKSWFKDNFQTCDYKITVSNIGFGSSINMSIRWKKIPDILYTKKDILFGEIYNYGKLGTQTKLEL